MTNPPALVEEFMELARLDVGSRRERAIADALKVKFEALGCLVEEDGTAARIGGDAGNLIIRLPGDPDRPALLFSAHLDRVENHGHIQPVVEGDRLKSDGTSILAADDLTGICAILDGLRRVQALGEPHGDVEVVLSVAEEIGLLGSKYLDYSRLRSQMGYVLDAAGPLGVIVNQCPTNVQLLIKVHGRSAHAGLAPEAGLNALKVAATALAKLPDGRLSPATTANFGVIRGGQATNIVCDFCEIKAEARSTRPEELTAHLETVKRVFEETARAFGTAVDLEIEEQGRTFLIHEDEEVIRIARRALDKLGFTPRLTASGGNMDGNNFNRHGIKTVGLAPGFEKVHTCQEAQPIAALLKSGELVAALIREAAMGE